MSEPQARSGPLRILMTADTVGGVFSYATTLARAFSDRGMAVALATMGRPPSPDQRAELRSIERLVCFESSFALEWMDEPWADVDAAGDWLLAIESQFVPNVVHLNGYCHASLPWSVPALVVGHSCVCSWWRAVLGEAVPSRYETYRARVRAGLLRASTVVTPSRALLESLEREYGYSGQGLVIRNAVETPRYHSRPKRELYLAAGRLWDSAKNLELLERVAPRLPWPLHIAGESAPAHGARENVVLLGQLTRDELALRMAEAPVFLHPARYEPFGLAPLEAALSGAALVLGDIASLREVWGDAAVYVRPDDADALLDAATRLATDVAWRADLAARARARAIRYDLASMADAYQSAYLGLLERAPRSSVRSASSPPSASERVATR